MAQETAGTIGIPVLKNEILPYIDQYARRRDRAEQLKAAQAYKMQLLKQKEEEKAAQISSKQLPGAAGNYFSSINKDRISERMKFLQSEVASGKRAQSDINMLSDAAIVDTESDNKLSDFATKMMNERAEKLSAYGVPVSPGMTQQYVSTQYSNTPDADKPGFFNQNHVDQLEAYLLQRPESINVSALASTLMKDAPVSSMKVQVGKTTEGFDWYNDIFDVEEKTVNGLKAMAADKVNIDKADSYVARNPMASKISKLLIEQEKLTPSVSILPTADQEKAAKERVYERMFRPYAKIKYTRDVERTPSSGGRRGGSSKVPVAGSNTIQMGTTNVNVPVYDFEVPSGSEIVIGQKETVYNTQSKRAVPITSGSELTSPRVGWMAIDKRTKKYIDPDLWSTTPIENVDFVPGFYGVTAEYQKDARGLKGPATLGEQIFIPAGRAGTAKTVANNVLVKNGSSYSKESDRTLKETKALFKTTTRF